MFSIKRHKASIYITQLHQTYIKNTYKCNHDPTKHQRSPKAERLKPQNETATSSVSRPSAGQSTSQPTRRCAYVLHSICPSTLPCRTAVRHGCTCSGRIGRPGTCTSWSSSPRSSSLGRQSGRSIGALSACQTGSPGTTRCPPPSVSGWRRSRSACPCCWCLEGKHEEMGVGFELKVSRLD